MNLILSTSLRTESSSRLLAQEARRVLDAEKIPTTYVDLRDYPMPFCDGGDSYSHPNVAALEELLEKASSILVATPIYNYDANAAVKNLIELTGSGWENKAVGFLCAAGGMSSYMSVMALANSLMLDFRSMIVPRFVYATSDAFAAGQIIDPEIARRTGELARFTARLGDFLRAAA